MCCTNVWTKNDLSTEVKDVNIYVYDFSAIPHFCAFPIGLHVRLQQYLSTQRTHYIRPFPSCSKPLFQSVLCVKLLIWTNEIIAWFVRDIYHKYHSRYFKIVSKFTRLTAREITYNNFEISLVVFMPNITTNHAITYTSIIHYHKKGFALSLFWKVRVFWNSKMAHSSD